MTRPDLRYLGAALAFAVGAKLGSCPCSWVPGEVGPEPLATLAADDCGPKHISTCSYIARFGDGENGSGEECAF